MKRRPRGMNPYTGEPGPSHDDLLSNPRDHDYLGHYDQPPEDSELIPAKPGDCVTDGHAQIVSQTIDEKRSTVDDRDESTHLRWENLRQVDIEAIAPEPPFVTIHFYANDPDSMQTLRRYLNADDVLWAVQEFDQWLRAKVKYSDETTEELQDARLVLHQCFTDRGLDMWEE